VCIRVRVCMCVRVRVCVCVCVCVCVGEGINVCRLLSHTAVEHCVYTYIIYTHTCIILDTDLVSDTKDFFVESDESTCLLPFACLLAYSLSLSLCRRIRSSSSSVREWLNVFH